MTYTKGKWQVGEENDVFSDGCACIARVCGAPEGIKESIANAHLITAAPVLYETLKAICYKNTLQLSPADFTIMCLALKAAEGK